MGGAASIFFFKSKSVSILGPMKFISLLNLVKASKTVILKYFVCEILRKIYTAFINASQEFNDLINNYIFESK